MFLQLTETAVLKPRSGRNQHTVNTHIFEMKDGNIFMSLGTETVWLCEK